MEHVTPSQGPGTPNTSLEGHKLLIIQNWDFSQLEGWIQKARATHPGLQIECRSITSLEAPDADRSIFNDATIILAFNTFPVDRKEGPKLQYLQLSGAGYDHMTETEWFKDPSISFCTSNGVHPPQISEWVFWTFLAFQHHAPLYNDLHAREDWIHFSQMPLVEDCVGLRMGVLGYGAIGRQCARLAKAFGMDVIAYTARERSTPESRADYDGFREPGMGDPDGQFPSAWYHGTSKESLNHFLGQDIDILLICMPLTPLTRRMIAAEQFEILSKKKAFVSNVGRGELVNQEDLVKALETGQIRGAAIDVADPEPLPAGHPLWKAPNLFITPHASWLSKHTQTRVLAIMAQNLERLSLGKPLINSVARR